MTLPQQCGMGSLGVPEAKVPAKALENVWVSPAFGRVSGRRASWESKVSLSHKRQPSSPSACDLSRGVPACTFSFQATGPWLQGLSEGSCY